MYGGPAAARHSSDAFANGAALWRPNGGQPPEVTALWRKPSTAWCRTRLRGVSRCPLATACWTSKGFTTASGGTC
eukprot:7789639-Pyramimonas_sp.AAC.1